MTSWGLGLEHEFLPVTKVSDDTWEALTIAQMLEMMNGIKTPEPVTHDTGDVINNGVIRLFKLVQPVRNSKLAAKLTKTTEPVYTGKDQFYSFHVAKPKDPTLMKVSSSDGFSPPDTSDLHGTKVSVTVAIFIWGSIRVQIIPDKNGHVYDFSKLEKDVVTTIRHISRKRVHEQVNDVINLPYTMDSGFLEVTSKNYKNATVDSVVKEVKKFEKIVLRDCAPHLATPEILPHAMMLGAKETYAGSYHVWITLPHSTGVKFDHIKFINDHSRAVVFLQWMEPLLLACMCPDPRSPGEGVKHSRASMRSKLNYLSGIGAAKMRVPEPQAILVHESLEALNSGRSPTSRVLDAVWETTESGAMINVLACHSQERYSDQAAWNRMAGNSITNHGTDIRFDTCTNIAFEQLPRAAVVMVDKRAMLARPTKPDSTKYKLSTASKLKPAGFEFRMFDHFPSAVAHELVATVVTLSALTYTKSNLSKVMDVQTHREWVQQVGMSALYGSRGPVDAAYWSRLRKTLGLRTVKVPDTCYAALTLMLKDVYTACMGVTAAKRCLKKFAVSRAVEFPDANFEIWKTSALSKINKKQLITLKEHGEHLSEDDVEKILGSGWIPDIYALRALSN